MLEYLTIDLIRNMPDKDGTFGQMCFGGERICVTVENTDMLIPPGTYLFKKFKSPHNGNCWLASYVPNHTMIEIHIANYASELKGCIAVGRYFDRMNGLRCVKQSGVTMSKLYKILPDEFLLRIR